MISIVYFTQDYKVKSLFNKLKSEIMTTSPHVKIESTLNIEDGWGAIETPTYYVRVRSVTIDRMEMGRYLGSRYNVVIFDDSIRLPHDIFMDIFQPMAYSPYGDGYFLTYTQSCFFGGVHSLVKFLEQRDLLRISSQNLGAVLPKENGNND